MQMPAIIYGTAWKKERTADLVELALETGFRGIDTACQPKHYNEPLVGEGIKRAYGKGLKRQELFIQTKFTPLGGQDPDNIPYDPDAPLPDRVHQSLAVSKQNLHTDYLDSLVLHSPLETWGKTMEVWQVFESFVEKGDVKQIGISNCYDPEVLDLLCQESKIKPTVVQNRFYQATGYDQHIRQLCQKYKMAYQSFWTLTANPHLFEDKSVQLLAKEKDKTAPQLFFRYLLQQGITPLTGTTDQIHMQQDLAVTSFELSAVECELLTDVLLQRPS